MYEIKAELESPLMIGGKTLNSNYRESRDYIPGSVLRAAYAKALTERCDCTQKNGWLEYRGLEECGQCRFRAVCSDFAKITFPTLYPMGSVPYLATAREEKYKAEGERGIWDILMLRLTEQEKAEEESGWVRAEGLHKGCVPVRLMHSAVTRTAIDYRRNVAREGALYTQNVVLEQYKNEKTKELEQVHFSGRIDLSPEQKDELSRIKILHVGADITRGSGICRLSFGKKEDGDTIKSLRKRIKKLNSHVEGEKRYVSVDLLTDAYLGLEEFGNEGKAEPTDEAMREFLRNKIGLSEKYYLKKVFKSQEVLRGFDTSKAEEAEMRRQGKLVVKAGAVFAFEADAADMNEEELLALEKKGIGKNTEHGFGRITVCDPFHAEHAVLRSGKNG